MQKYPAGIVHEKFAAQDFQDGRNSSDGFNRLSLMKIPRRLSAAGLLIAGQVGTYETDNQCRKVNRDGSVTDLSKYSSRNFI